MQCQLFGRPNWPQTLQAITAVRTASNGTHGIRYTAYQNTLDAPGAYFWASAENWHALLESVLRPAFAQLKVTPDGFDRWAALEGEGIYNQRLCSDLADTIEAALKVDLRKHIPAPEGDGSIDRDHVFEFVTFLRHCGGFKMAQGAPGDDL